MYVAMYGWLVPTLLDSADLDHTDSCHLERKKCISYSVVNDEAIFERSWHKKCFVFDLMAFCLFLYYSKSHITDYFCVTFFS